jgi:hypothetical protein
MTKQCTQCGLTEDQTFEPFFETKHDGTLCVICIDFSDEHDEKLHSWLPDEKVMKKSTQRFEIKDAPAWMTKKATQKKRLDNQIFNRAMETAKKISSEREIRRLKWGI